MNRFALILCLLVGICLVPGCGGNPREEAMNKMMTILSETSTNLNYVKRDIETAIQEAKKKDTKVTEQSLEKAIKEAKKLHDQGKNLLSLKVKIDELNKNLTEAQEKELNSTYRPQLESRLQDIVKAQRELDSAVAEVAKYADDPKTVETLENAIREAREEFVVATRDE